ncbi:hypothetical protein ABB37_09801 [Leptomonas pyrrhocoris]|uniref:Amastin-like surface protein-like protein n=1 Tax=Leptomonas pyrrhocoris TaxID=157538 RepID=A0A0N0DR17_LEPPY|nr:hypothetical protein ABB37_09801 [Leptomonas pyrrhocoris]KPA73481.1 hypothetical protein ABB37_09801 [Leptomonas pyrrhocoris]|eukprot:XP_015651920.1 hypothetical protein ABB37_09801 [Leptomonas pyrrhocoris]
MACYTVVRIIVLILSIVALAFAVIGVFVPFLVVPASKQNELDALNMTVRSPSFDISKDAATLQKFSQLAGSPPAKSTMTLWKLKYGNARDGTTTVDLRDEYFSCYAGNMLIQAAEGVAVVTCVLGVANLILSAFTFTFAAVVKFPLALYFFLSGAAAAVTFGIMLNLYLHGWCGDASMKSSYWDLTAGFAFYVISCVLSLVASVLTMFID